MNKFDLLNAFILNKILYITLLCFYTLSLNNFKMAFPFGYCFHIKHLVKIEKSNSLMLYQNVIEDTKENQKKTTLREGQRFCYPKESVTRLGNNKINGFD